MAYQVLARKWRPGQFDDVVGQKHVTETLKNAIKTKRIAHAYLFVGPRGIGKTSVARILAKALNCVNGPTVTPCDKCDSCLEISEGRSIDVLEIDGASNNTVDQIRDLRDTVKFLPARDRFKVYIIDEVHMLTQQAFNALLKTLEEPPPHVKFIFATTEPQKVLPTIISRCQRFDLCKIPSTMIVSRLASIAKDEGVEVEADALLAVARGGEGSLRDAESALDQLFSFKGGKITEEDVLSVFGLVSRQALEDMVDAILKGDVSSLMERIASLDAAGKDIQRLLVDLLAYFRNLLVSVHAGVGAGILDITPAQADALRRQAKLCSQERLLEMAELLIETDGRLRYALSKRTLLEVALIRCARSATSVSIDEILDQVNRLKKAFADAGVVGSAGTAAAAVEEAGQPALRDAPKAQYRTDGSREAKPVPSEPAPIGDELAFLTAHWHDVVDRTGMTAPLARSVLLDACPLSVDAKVAVIGFDPEFAEHMKRMGVPRHRAALQGVLGTTLRRNVEVRFQLMSEEGKKTLPTDARPESTEQAVPGLAAKNGPDQPPKKVTARKTVAELLKDDAIRKTVEAFNGEIIDVRE